MVPVVEPEVLMDGQHTLERCCEVTEEVLKTVFSQLYIQGVTLEGMILKPNMVLPGSTCSKQEAVDEVAMPRSAVSCDPSPPQSRGLRSYRAANPRNWLRPV